MFNLLIALLLSAPTALADTFGGPGLPSTYLTPSYPPFPVSKPPHGCKHSWSTTYSDAYGPLLVENRYSCDRTSSTPPLPIAAKPIIVPAPYSSPAGQHGVDPMIASRGTLKRDSDFYVQSLLSAVTKTTISSYGCSPLLPNPNPIDEDKFNSLFWALRELSNQTCLDPGEVAEFSDMQKLWIADWRFTVANVGKKRRCERFAETGNVAEALHYFCFFAGVGVGGDGKASEVVSWGGNREEGGEDGEDVRWCVRYSERGWGEGSWREKCLGMP